MDLYFQADWSDLRSRLVTYIGDALSGELPDGLTVRTGKGIVLTGDGKPERYRPEVAVMESWERGFPPVWKPEGDAGEGAVVAEPLVFDEPDADRWIEIRDVQGKLITALELLSLTNKRSPGWLEYKSKQHGFLSAGVNLVEIDFIRGGEHVTTINPDRLFSPTVRAITS